MKRIFLIALIISCFANTVFGREFSDITGHEHSSAINLLGNLEIINGYEDGTFRPDNNITRAEFLTMILRTLEFEGWSETYAENSRFTDVFVSDWSAGIINLSHELGFVNGYEDGTFGGNNNIIYNEAVKILVSVLGYDVAAQSRGGYPSGYLLQAASLGLLKGVSASQDIILRGTAAEMIYNALEVDIMEGEYGAEITYRRGQSTILGNNHIRTFTGIVTGAFGTEYNAKRVMARNEVEISGITYTTGLTGLSKYIGRSVKVYVKDTEELARPVVLHVVDKLFGDDVVINADDIVTKTDLNNLYYKVGDNERRITLGDDLTIIYNGKVLTTAQMTPSKLQPVAGTVTLIASDSGKYDLAIVKDYENYVVSSIYKDKIYGLLGEIVEVDPDDNGLNVQITKNGREIEFSEISVNDVVSIAKSPDGIFWDIIVSSDILEGYIEESGVDRDGKIFYSINSDEYYMAANYLKAYNTNNSKLKKLNLGDGANFYLDVFGKIAYSEPGELSRELVYGYLIDAKNEKGLDGNVTFRLLTTSNKIELYTNADGKRIIFGRTENNTYTADMCTPQYVLEKISTAGEVNRQLVQYQLNDNNELTSIYTAAGRNNQNYLSLDNPQSSTTYSNGVLDQIYIADNKTALFHIPNNGLYEEQFSASFAGSYLKNNNRYPAALYDIENSHVGAMVVADIVDRYITDKDGREIIIDKVNSPVMLIEKSKTIKTDDGITYMVLEGHSNKKTVTVLVSNTLSNTAAARTDLAPGMIIQYQDNQVVLDKALTSDYDRVMVVYKVLFNCNDINAEPFQNWNYGTLYASNAPIGTSYGKVETIDIPNMVVTLKRGAQANTRVPFVLTGGTYILRYRRAAKSVEVAAQEDIQIGQNAFVRQRYNNVREVIIVE